VVGGRHAVLHNEPGTARLPNGDFAPAFDGIDQYAEIPDSDAFSVDTTKRLTVEVWMRPDTLENPKPEGSGYVHVLGKGVTGQHEWALRMYNLTNVENRPNRCSAYVWALAGGVGYGSYVQEPLTAGEWMHLVFVVDDDANTMRLYKNGTLRDTDSHAAIELDNGTGPVRLGTRNFSSWFNGALGKFAIYDTALSADRIRAHYEAMERK
jgi:hypothetical protein